MENSGAGIENNLFAAILIAATIPLVVSILSAFSPRTRVKDVEGYFLFDRNLDIDSFLKTTVGYSLQVASITLFFYWSYTYGIIGSLIVCAAWSSGYYLMAVALGREGLQDFLRNATGAGGTIHGFIGERMRPSRTGLKKAAVLFVSLASVIGLGGTMMAEIDYSSQFFVGTLQLANATDIIRIPIQGAVLAFAVLYVLWGGYKSAVYTDRFQVPVAYVAFSTFGLGCVVLAGSIAATNGAAYLVLAMGVLFGVLLWRRYGLLNAIAKNDRWDVLTAIFTFGPIILAAIATIIYLTRVPNAWSLSPVMANLFPRSPGPLGLLFPPSSSFLGFGGWGTVALVFANGIWQFIDISSLQRLQSLDKSEVVSHRERAAKALRATGLEAGIGWLLIALTAALLRASGLTLDLFGPDGFSNETFGRLLHTAVSGKLAILIPVFVFTTVVYMLSTISGFISAISYISFYDIVPSLTKMEQNVGDLKTKLQAARVTTVVVIASIFFAYLLLRELMAMAGNGGAIASVLYAIYAFQIAIAPSAILALLAPHVRISPSAAILSVVGGLVVSYITAIDTKGWMAFQFVGMDAASWGVIPPLASAAVSTVIYAIVSVITLPFARRN